MVEQEPNTEILHKWSYRILIEMIQKDFDIKILIQKSSDLPQMVLQVPNISGAKKWSYTILQRILHPIQVVQKDFDIEILNE